MYKHFQHSKTMLKGSMFGVSILQICRTEPFFRASLLFGYSMLEVVLIGPPTWPLLLYFIFVRWP